MHDGRFTTYVRPDPLARLIDFRRPGGLARAPVARRRPGGLTEIRGQDCRNVIPGGRMLNSAMVVLCEGRGRRHLGRHLRQGLVAAEGRARRASSPWPRLVERPDPLAVCRTPTARSGSARSAADSTRCATASLSLHREGRPAERQHRAHCGRRPRSLWLSHDARHLPDRQAAAAKISTRGKLARSTPTNYGVEDGLRSAQCSPGIPTGGGGDRTVGRPLWFPTSRGLAVFDPARAISDGAAAAGAIWSTWWRTTARSGFQPAGEAAAGQRPRADPLYRRFISARPSACATRTSWKGWTPSGRSR